MTVEAHTHSKASYFCLHVHKARCVKNVQLLISDSHEFNKVLLYLYRTDTDNVIQDFHICKLKCAAFF